MKQSIFETRRRVEFCETDMAGIVHFSNFYRWMEQAEHEFVRSLGLTIVDHQADGVETIGWPRVTAQCRFLSPARYDQWINVKLMVERIGVKSLTFRVEFSCEGRPVAVGTMKTCCARVRPGEPLQSTEIPAAWLEAIEEFKPDPA